MAIEIVLLSSYLFMGSNLVGVATSTYNSGSWDGTGIANTFKVGGENAQQYAELAKSMAHGQLYMEETPPQCSRKWTTLTTRLPRRVAEGNGRGLPVRRCLSRWHYYVYFGVVPVLVFYLPFYLITGSNFPTAIGVS
mgnify:CR=1 FL=1